MAERPDYFVKSVDKTLAVLLAFSGGNTELTVSQVATATDQTRASARRFLLTLADLGYLQANGNAFRMTPRVLDIGAAYLSGLTLPQAAVGHLQLLARDLEETASLCVLEGQDVLYVERVTAPRLHALNVSIGNRLPAWVTSMGRVLIAHLEPAEQAAFLERVDLHPYTEHTVPDLSALKKELATVREQQWSLVNQELDEGLRGLAVPVLRGGKLLGALNISVQTSRNNPEVIRDELLPRLRQTAQEIADDFGGRLS